MREMDNREPGFVCVSCGKYYDTEPLACERSMQYQALILPEKLQEELERSVDQVKTCRKGSWQIEGRGWRRTIPDTHSITCKEPGGLVRAGQPGTLDDHRSGQRGLVRDAAER